MLSDDRSVCNCWPLCDSIEYDVDHVAIAHNISKWYPNDEGYEYTELKFQFKDFQFQPIKREELYTDLDFVSNIGGLLSLFIGTSFLSLIEICFFFTVRFFIHVRENAVEVDIEVVEEPESDDENNAQISVSPTAPYKAWT